MGTPGAAGAHLRRPRRRRHRLRSALALRRWAGAVASTADAAQARRAATARSQRVLALRRWAGVALEAAEAVELSRAASEHFDAACRQQEEHALQLWTGAVARTADAASRRRDIGSGLDSESCGFDMQPSEGTLHQAAWCVSLPG